MNTHFKHEQTLVVIKPDGIQRSLIGEVIQRYERVGLKLVAIKMVVPTEDFIEKHAVAIVRKITGGTEPLTSPVGTIRGDYVLDSYQMSESDVRSVRNIIHASGSVAEAKNEIVHWFTKDEIIDYKVVQEQIMYDVNLDGIFG